MKKFLLFLVAVIVVTVILWLAETRTVKTVYITPKAQALTLTPEQILSSKIQNYLQNKNSPLAPDSDFLAQQPHWKLIVAISNAESTFCQHQRAFNCWGLGGNDNLRVYSSFKAAIQDENDFIESWQAKGKWLTPESMNGSYVVPASANWLHTVNSTLKDFQNF